MTPVPIRSIFTRALSIVILLLAGLLLAACGGGNADQPAAASFAPLAAVADAEASAPPVAPVIASNWTTLGTRQSPSQPVVPVTVPTNAHWVDYDPPAIYPKSVSRPLQFIPMTDGTELAVYVTLPADASGAAITDPLPTILVQTSYNGGTNRYLGAVGSALGAADPYMTAHGYVTVVVDVRGTGQSGGTWKAFGNTEQADYGQVVKWVTQQPWFDGAIGVYGVSYLGITAIITASQNHPAVKAAFPIVPIGDGYRDIVFTGGQVNPTFMPLWLGLVSGLGVTDPCLLTHPAQCLPNVLNHLGGALTGFQVPTLLKALLGDKSTLYDGDFWAQRSPLENDADIRVPTFVVGGLHDLFQRSEPLSYAAIKNHAPAKLLIGPWTHLQAALGQGLPVDGVPPLNHIELMWFDQYLKGLDVGAAKLPNVTQFVSGYGHYATSVDWPNPQAKAERLYLHGDKSLSSSAPAADEKSHFFVASPLEGLCSQSLSQWTAGLLGYLPIPCFTNDNSADRWNVNYETAPMVADYYMNGPIEADLWISSTAKDAQLSVRVADVAPNGVAVALTNGVQLASMRAVDSSRSRFLDGQMIQPWHPFTEASKQPLTPNLPALVRVEIFATSALIKQGHRLRISVGASNVAQALPALPDLLDTLGSFTTTIYNDAAHPSSVVIPVVPASQLKGL